jgi:hypothetical protein
VLQEDVESGEIESTDAEMAELRESMAALQNEPEILIREGLIFDYPRSTKVIPDQLCKTLVGFIGSRHITIEYEYTLQEVRELFDGADLKECASFTPDGKAFGEVAGDTDSTKTATRRSMRKAAASCASGSTTTSRAALCITSQKDTTIFARAGGAGRVRRRFWPVYALTFNEVESEDELFPPSDVHLLLDMQNEHNRSRQGKREHREAARPRWVYPNGAIDEEDVERSRK